MLARANFVFFILLMPVQFALEIKNNWFIEKYVGVWMKGKETADVAKGNFRNKLNSLFNWQDIELGNERDYQLAERMMLDPNWPLGKIINWFFFISIKMPKCLL